MNAQPKTASKGPRLMPMAETVTALDALYQMGTGHTIRCSRIDCDRVTFDVVICPCAGITIERGRCCRGHARPMSFGWADWKRHCADGWARMVEAIN